MRSLFSGFFGLLVIFNCFCQQYTANQIKEDLNQLKSGIIEFNPGLYKYNPDFDQKADSLISSVSGEFEKYGAYTMFSMLCAFSNEGHFEIGQWSDAVHQPILSDDARFMPISVYILNDKIYIARDMTDEGLLERGAEIIKINEKSSTETIEKLKSVTPSDGDIETYQIRKLNYHFPWYYYFYVEQPDVFDLTLNVRGEEIQVSLSALSRKQRIENFNKRNSSPNVGSSISDVYELDLADKYAYLHLKSFDFRVIEKYNLKGSSFYKEIFQKINEHGRQSLIIDLRGNTGGRNEFGDEIVPYISQEDSYDFLLKNTSWKGKTKFVKVKKGSKDKYKGSVFVLVDGNTYSTGGVVAWALRELNGAVFIGEETGTRYEGFVAGSKQYTTLLHTGIRIGVPCYLKEFPVGKKQNTKNRGLIPDHVIKPGIDDLLNDRDPVLDFAIKLASKI